MCTGQRVWRHVVKAAGVVLLVGLFTGVGHAFASGPSAAQGGVPLSSIQGDPFCLTGSCYAASLTVNTTTGNISGSCDNLTAADQCSIAGTLTGTNASFTINLGFTEAVNGTLSGTTITGSFVESKNGVPNGASGSFSFTGITVTSVSPCTGTSCGTNATPELGSGELLATGLLPIGAMVLYRRRRAHRATKQ